MTRLSRLYILGLLLLLSCAKSATDAPAADTMEQLHVPYHFNYSNSSNVHFRLRLVIPEAEREGLVFLSIKGKSIEQEEALIFSGAQSSFAIFQTVLPIPLHFRQLIIETRYQGIIREFQLTRSDAIEAALVLYDKTVAKRESQ